MLRMAVKEAGAEDSEAGKRMLALASRYSGLRHPNRKRGARASRRELKGIAGGAEIIARGLAAYRAGAGRPAQTLALHHLLERQHYRLGALAACLQRHQLPPLLRHQALAGLRVEDAGTFDAMHRLVQRLIAEGKLQGLRLDHIDGLRDPAQYFQRLRRLIREAQGGRRKTVLHAWSRRSSARARRCPRSPAFTAPPAMNG